MEGVTLRFRHAGLFRKSKDELHYLGGEKRIFNGDSDELCWLWLKELTKKCGPYMKIE